jgi:hypothetical protein
VYIESLKEHNEPTPPSIDEENCRGSGVSILPQISGREVVSALSKIGYERNRQI